jgi:hypothetical protein
MVAMLIVERPYDCKNDASLLVGGCDIFYHNFTRVKLKSLTKSLRVTCVALRNRSLHHVESFFRL